MFLYLGHVIDGGGLHPPPVTTSAIYHKLLSERIIQGFMVNFKHQPYIRSTFIALYIFKRRALNYFLILY